MSKTLDSLKGSGAQVCMVLAVQGYDKLITNHSDPQQVLEAWDGTAWQAAIVGLRVKGTIEQGFEPWSRSIDASPLTFHVVPEETDDFAQAVFKSKPSAESRLDEVFHATTGSTTLKVKNAGDFPTSGRVFLGAEAINYTSKDGTSGFNISAGGSGVLAPFTVDGGSTWPTMHDIGDKQSWEMSPPPKVTDVQRNWVGKWVGLYIHQIVGGVVVSRSDAHLVYAGQIRAIQDDGEATVLETEEVRAKIRDTVLLREQFQGKVREGLSLVTGDVFRLGTVQGSSAENLANDLVVVASGANGADNVANPELNAGVYRVDELAEELNTWLRAQESNLSADVSAALQSTTAGMRFQFRAQFSSSGARRIQFRTNRYIIARFLGFNDGLFYVEPFWWSRHIEHGTSVVEANSDETPYRVLPFQAVGDGESSTMVLSHTEGKWFQQSQFVPSALRHHFQGDDRGLLMVGDQFVVAKRESDTVFAEARVPGRMLYGITGETRHLAPEGLRADEPGDVEVKQVVFLAGQLKDIVLRVFASINGDGVNHGTYDAFPAQMAAAIPWGLLGQNFERSLDAISELTENNAVSIPLYKPTKLLDVLVPEMVLRFVMLVWVSDTDNPGLQFRALPTPNATTPDWILDETNKARPTGNRQRLDLQSRVSHDWLRNVVKIEYNRGLDGEYRDSITIEDPVSIGEYDERRPVTISAFNSFGDFLRTGEAVEAKAGRIAAALLPAFARPTHLWTRSISGALFPMAPGDQVRVSDDTARDPDTGRRGLSNRAAVVLKNVHAYGGDGADLMGRVTLLFSIEDRQFPYSPSAEIEGYTAGTKRLELDSVEGFESGHAVRVVEVNPEHPELADTFTDEIAAVDEDNDTADLVAGFGAGGRPDFDAGKAYRLLSDKWTEATPAQRLHAFQAGEDGTIEGEIGANQWAEQSPILDGAEATAGDAPEILPVTYYGDGEPLSEAIPRALARAVNHLENYRVGAPQMSIIFDTTSTIFNPGAGNWQTLRSFLAPIGASHIPAGMRRALMLRPLARGDGVDPARIRVTTSKYPLASESLLNAVFPGPVRQVEWETGATMGILEEKELEPIPATVGNGSLTWITVEGALGPGSGRFAGFASFYLAPLEAA